MKRGRQCRHDGGCDARKRRNVAISGLRRSKLSGKPGKSQRGGAALQTVEMFGVISDGQFSQHRQPVSQQARQLQQPLLTHKRQQLRRTIKINTVHVPALAPWLQ